MTWWRRLIAWFTRPRRREREERRQFRRSCEQWERRYPQ